MATAGMAAVTLDRRLQFGPYAYDYYIRSGPRAWDEFTDRLKPLAADRFALVVSEGVPAEFRRRITECLRAAMGSRGRRDVIILGVADGEATKTLTAVRDMEVEMFKGGFRRRSVVVSFGGGKASNMAGLLAGLTLRGVPLVHVPTTWLNLWDAAGASLKQAVNLFEDEPAGASPVGKNLIGLFKAPEFVFGITDVMRDLPANEIRSAIGEVIKSVMAISPEQIPVLRELLRPDARYTIAELVQIAAICVDAKQKVMRDDPYEKGPALACELGHTCGHVIELRWGLPHGLAILIGCLIATRVAIKLGYLDPSAEPVLEDLARRNGARLMLPPGPSDQEILAALDADNKRGRLPEKARYVDLVLLDDFGKLHYTDGVPLTQVHEDTVLEAFRSRISAKEHALAGLGHLPAGSIPGRQPITDFLGQPGWPAKGMGR